MALKFEDLTDEQINYFWNGVGSDHFFLNPPDLIFGEASKRHDFAYWMGATEQDRKDADERFYLEGWKATLKNNHKILRPFYFFMSWFYFKVLGLIGNKAFEYCTEEEKPKTWEELKARIDKRRQEGLKKSVI